MKSKQVELEVIRKSSEEEQMKLLDEVLRVYMHILLNAFNYYGTDNDDY